MDASNWINLGILTVTALVGILAWLGARHAALEARKQQQEANAAATRSASAAEEATRLQAKALELEESRQQDTLLDSRRAKLRCTIEREQKFSSSGKLQNDTYLVIANNGQSAARNIQASIGGDSFDDCGQILNDQPIGTYVIGSESELRFHLCLYMGGGIHPPFETAISWDDESGVRGQWEGTVT
jgi:hypothetical protein